MNQHKDLPNDGHQSEKAECPYCQRRFDTYDLLNVHIVTQHTLSKATLSKLGVAKSGKN
jgi:hypothetical protein